MRFLICYLLIFVSPSLYARVESVDLFPDLINAPGFTTTSPSMNEAQNRMCFLQSGKKGAGVRIMVTDKSGNGHPKRKMSNPVFLITQVAVFG